MAKKSKQKCEWFLLCGRPASGVQSHPILGNVPICKRCKAWYDRIGAQTAKTLATDAAEIKGKKH